MKKIDHATATDDDEFTEGNPSTGTPATRVTAQWLNVLQNEVANVVEAAGITLDQTGVDQTQLLEALEILFSDDEGAGFVKYWGTDTVPTGYLECNGAAVSRTTYATLFSKIGTTFGAGNGTTTFNLPDIRGEFIRGWDNSRGVDSGRAFGSAQVATKHRWALGNTPGGILVIAASDYDSQITESYAPQNPSTTLAASTSWQSFTARPRNVALMPCIKY